MNSIFLIILVILVILVNIILLFYYPGKDGYKGDTGIRGPQGYGFPVLQNYNKPIELDLSINEISISNLQNNFFYIRNNNSQEKKIILSDSQSFGFGTSFIIQNWSSNNNITIQSDTDSFGGGFFLNSDGSFFSIPLKSNSSVTILNSSTNYDNPKILTYYYSTINFSNLEGS
jgi:hypothetical protein